LIGIGVLIIGRSKLSPRVAPVKEYEFEDKTNGELNNIRKRKMKALLFGITASLAWAIGLVLIDVGVKEIDSILNLGSLSSVIGNVIRFPFAFFFLFLMGWREESNNRESKERLSVRISKNTFLFLIIASILGTSIGVFLYTEAARTAGGTVLSLITTANPLFALPLTYLINKEKISKIGFIGVLLTIIGVILIII
jgi:drug/metabolite transporter (DMT)-like permease